MADKSWNQRGQIDKTIAAVVGSQEQVPAGKRKFFPHTDEACPGIAEKNSQVFRLQVIVIVFWNG